MHDLDTICRLNAERLAPFSGHPFIPPLGESIVPLRVAAQLNAKWFAQPWTHANVASVYQTGAEQAPRVFHFHFDPSKSPFDLPTLAGLGPRVARAAARG